MDSTSGSTSPADGDPRRVVWVDLGRMEYAAAWQLQREIQQGLIDAKRLVTAGASVGASAGSKPPPNVLLTVEHPPVFTIGKSGDAANLLASEGELRGLGATFVQTDRGGDVTFHGPGQLVGYPILDLDRFFTDVGRYLRTLETVIIDTCAGYGLAAGRVDGRTGVWIDAGRPTERKICAMGIRCSRWVTMHGFALNVNTELDFYDSIVPCGISDRDVTSLATELGTEVSESDCRGRVVEQFASAFGARVTKLESINDLASLGFETAS